MVTTIPPSPVVIVLFPKKLNVEISPNVPTCLPLYLEPIASADAVLSEEEKEERAYYDALERYFKSGNYKTALDLIKEKKPLLKYFKNKKYLAMSFRKKLIAAII